MIKSIANRVWAFDLEWVPDPEAGRLLYGLPRSASADEVLQVMWREGGASDDDPTPFLKTVLCRVVSVATVERRVRPDGEVALHLMTLPHDPASREETDETHLVSTFLAAVGQCRPQLVGFGSIASDLRILVQRGVILGLEAGAFARRPDKPWEGVDYLGRGNDWNVDLKELLGGWGKAVPSLHEVAVQCGIPGKMDTQGNDVARLWLDGDLGRIVRYNQFDALTTYLLWLRVARFSGLFSDEGYAAEQERVRDVLRRLGGEEGGQHLLAYLAEWERLEGEVAAGRG